MQDNILGLNRFEIRPIGIIKQVTVHFEEPGIPIISLPTLRLLQGMGWRGDTEEGS